MADTPETHRSQDARDQTVGPTPTESVGAGPGVPSSLRRALSQLRRELTSDELSSPGAQKLLLEMLDRAEIECEGARIYVERYHATSMRAAVLEEKVRGSKAFEVLYSMGLTIGGVLIGLYPKLGIVSGIIGLILVAASAAAKLFLK